MTRLLAMLAVAGLFAVSCTNAPAPTSNEDTTKAAAADKMNASDKLEKNKSAAMASLQGINSHDISAVLKDIATDFVEYGDGSGTPVKGMDSCKASLQMFFTAFPDIKGENLTAMAEGDRVVVFGDWSGTFKGKMMNMAPTGKSFKIKDADVFTFNENGQMTSHRSIQSMATMMMQVGPDKKK